MEKRVFNFSAGPAILPLAVLEEVQRDLISYKGCGMSVMEMSHRSKDYQTIIDETEATLRRVMNIPENYDVLFLQGGASLQFPMIPMNLNQPGKPMEVVLTGVWTKKAVKEMKEIGEVNIIASSEDKNFSYIPALDSYQVDPNASFVFITTNNTIFGTEFNEYPETGDVPLIADMSSNIMSRDLDVSKFGVIYAGAQKNMGPSGVTLVIIRKDLVEKGNDDIPTMLQYKTHAKNGSMFNTPPTFGIYILGLVAKWVEDMGGINAIEEHNIKKAAMLYDVIDSNPFYYSPTEVASRSRMNVAFRITGDKEDLEAKFIAEAKEQGILNIKGHRLVGGLRASIYNAMPVEGIQALIDLMEKFAKENG